MLLDVTVCNQLMIRTGPDSVRKREELSVGKVRNLDEGVGNEPSPVLRVIPGGGSARRTVCSSDYHACMDGTRLLDARAIVVDPTRKRYGITLTEKSPEKGLLFHGPRSAEYLIMFVEIRDNDPENRPREKITRRPPQRTVDGAFSFIFPLIFSPVNYM